MKTPETPRPGDMDLERFRRAAATAIDLITSYHRSLDERRVLPAIGPSELAHLFEDELPEEGVSAQALLLDWQRRVSPFQTAVGSPRHFAFVNGSGAMIGILAEALAAATAANTGAWKLGPSAVEVERQCLRFLARFVGFPETTGGLIVSGGTMANVTALQTALRSVAPYDATPGGLQDPRRRGRFLVYVSDHEGHVSITRAVDLLNLGRDAVRRVPSRADFTMDPFALDVMLSADRARGDLPFAVVAQLGSVNVGAVDPIGALADVCARHGVWLHGDGAVGLLAAGLPETAPLFEGLDRADSVSVDGHKWLGVPPECGVVMVKDGERLRRAFSIHAPYLRGAAHDAEAFDAYEYGPQMSRGFKALPLWMVLRSFGARGLRELVGKNLALARHLHGLVSEHPDFQPLHAPTLPIVSFRFVPHELAEAAHEPEVALILDELNEDVAEAVSRSGVAFVMTTRIRGRVALRMSIASQRTLERDVDATFAAIARAGRHLLRAERPAA